MAESCSVTQFKISIAWIGNAFSMCIKKVLAFGEKIALVKFLTGGQVLSVRKFNSF